VKDPKKQEAGRKGAAVRRQKLETLKTELAATKEAVYRCEATNNEEHAALRADTKASAEGSSGGRSEGGWGVGIGLAVAAAVVLLAVRPYAEKRVLSFEKAKPLVPAPVQPSERLSTTSTSCGRAIFDME